MLSMFLFGSTFAQDRTITGTVTDAEDGSTLPGVSVTVAGTTIGTQTNVDGAFSISVPSTATTLIFTYIGYTRQTIIIGSKTTINVALFSDANLLSDVVVTALGISRQSKSLGYSATSVKSEEITKNSPVSLFDGLQGKVAGANITSQSGAPGASTKVVLRGYSSITGNNQPLYVIDGVPVNNSTFGRTGTNRSMDFGNNANDINPNDIESINILKGAGATSLYGSRAANGVIVITTKKGKLGKFSVDVNSSATFSSILMLPSFQNRFGQGWSGDFSLTENGSWGPKFNGIERAWGNVVDNSQLVKPFVALENNVRDFYTVGNEINNNFAISGGNEASTFYLSYGNITSDGIVPTDADSYKRNTISLRGSTEHKGFTGSASMNYVNKKSKFVATGQGSSTGATMFQELIQIPRDVSIIDAEDYTAKYYDVGTYFTPYAQNPYHVLNESGNDFNSDRIFGNVELGYKINDIFSTTGRIGLDQTSTRLKDWQAISSAEIGTPNFGNAAPDVGGVLEETQYVNEINTDLLLNFNAPINDAFTFDGLIGWNYNQRQSRTQSSSVEGLNIPKFYELSNSSSPPVATTGYSKRRLFGLYAQANFAYNNYLFLSLNARNDWSSTLPIDKNSFFYPAASLSFVLSDALEMGDSPISFAKVRASIGRTGNDASVYQVQSVLVSGDSQLNFGNISFPLNGVSGFELSNQIGNNTLQPELTTEYEFGLDLRFFANRLGIDFSYYDKKTDGQILAVPIASTTGYTSLITNFGLIQNKGIEFSLSGTPVKTDNFTWDLNYVFAKNRNKVLELPGNDEVVISSGYDVDFVAIKGQPLGVYKGPVEKRDPQGNMIVNPNTGMPLRATDKEVYGNSERDYTMGLTNTFRYNDWSLGFSFDYRKGGLFWSYTSQLNYFVGNAMRTTYNDRNTYIIPGSVNEVTTGGVVSYEENTTPIAVSDISSMWGSAGNPQGLSRNTVLDKTSLRMRDLTLSYSLPQSMANKISASRLTLTAYGRNLFIWLPGSNTITDPDASTYNNDLRGELGEFAAGPTTRSYGLSLKASF